MTESMMDVHVRDNLQYLKDIQDGVQGQDIYWVRGSTDATARGFFVAKARGSISAPSAVAPGDGILDFYTQAYNNGAYRLVTLIRSAVLNTGATHVDGLLDLYTYRSSDGASLLTARLANGMFTVPDGSASGPGLAFIADTDSGIYRVGADDWALVAGTSTALRLSRAAGIPQLGFYGTAPVACPGITGSRAGNAALTQLLIGLASMGIIVNGTTA